jgi:hypothetical protein
MNAPTDDQHQGSARRSIIEMWDAVVADFLAGGPAVPPALRQWYSSYAGTGRGKPELDALPEPFLGSLIQAKAVFLALNPGQADLMFQGRDGIFAGEIRRAGSYSAWAASWPYLQDPWVAKKGRNRHHSTRLQFMRNWVGDSQLTSSEMVSFELYPWHSAVLNAPIRPDLSIVEEFVWGPVAELRAPVFAFGAPWLSILETRLGLEVVDRLGPDGRRYPSTVASRRVTVLKSKGGVTIIAEKHAGSAGPPSREETLLLKVELARWL